MIIVMNNELIEYESQTMIHDLVSIAMLVSTSGTLVKLRRITHSKCSTCPSFGEMNISYH